MHSSFCSSLARGARASFVSDQTARAMEDTRRPAAARVVWFGRVRRPVRLRALALGLGLESDASSDEGAVARRPSAHATFDDDPLFSAEADDEDEKWVRATRGGGRATPS